MHRFFRRVAPTEGGKLKIVNPYTNENVCELPFQSLQERISALSKSNENFKKFKNVDPKDRIHMLENVLSTLSNEKN